MGRIKGSKNKISKKVKRMCQYCKKEFLIKPSDIKHGAEKHCSRKCRWQNTRGQILWDKRKGIKKYCKFCGKEIYAKPSHKNRKKFCSRKCHDKFREGKKLPQFSGKNAHSWKGGRTICQGYVYIRKPNHPFAKNGYVQQGRLVAEKYLGRYLEPSEIPHHINLDPSDNRPENLCVFETKSKHIIFHNYLKQNPILKTFLKSNLI